MNYNCLIVDDEKALAESTSEYFNLFDIKTSYVLNADKCLDFLKVNTADLILLDINLGSSSGFNLCKKLRKDTNIPILFISARQSDEDVLIALNIGGDDYIKKPYNLNVLLAKVKIALKRSKIPEKTSEIFNSKNLKIDYVTGKVHVNDKEITLKAMEYNLLCYFSKNPGRIINKEELFQNVWKDNITSDGTLNVHVRHLREKIEDDANNPKILKTVWSRGYIFEEIK